MGKGRKTARVERDPTRSGRRPERRVQIALDEIAASAQEGLLASRWAPGCR